MTMLPPIIHVVDDDASFRSALGELLSACGYGVALYELAERLLKTLPGGDPGCILLDVQMAGLSGPQLQDRLAELGCRLPIVFVTGHGDIPMTVQTIKAGAEDFLTKPVLKEKLLEVIGRALIRHEQIREQDARMAALRSLLSRLTPREQEVFTLLVRGKPHKQIAHALGTSERTVKMHRHNVMQKFQVNPLRSWQWPRNVLDYCRSPAAKEVKVPSWRRKNRNQQLAFCDDGARNRSAGEIKFGASCNARQTTDGAAAGRSQMRWKTSVSRTLRPASVAIPLATTVVGLTKRPVQLMVTLQSDVQFLDV